MQDVHPLFQKRRKIGDKFLCVDLRGFGHRPCRHRLIKFVKRHGLPQVVRVFPAVECIVKADVRNAPFPEMFCGQVGGGTAAQKNRRHGGTFFP